MRTYAAAISAGIVAVSALAGCTASAPSANDTDSDPSSFSLPVARQWVVDTSGWWVPEDPGGCLLETTECIQAAWPVRDYFRSETGDGVILSAFQHGAVLNLFCKAPTPEAIRNSELTESVFWFYAEYNGTKYWVPDIYVTRDDIDGMAAGVPDCPSNTPGINGRE